MQTRENCTEVGTAIIPLKDIFFDADGKLRSKPETAKNIESASHRYSGGAYRAVDCASLVGLQLVFDNKQLKEVKTQNLNSTDPSTIKSEMDRLVHQAQIYGKAWDKLQQLSEQQEIAPLIGEPENHRPPVTLSLPFLLQLNITRFGTITLVVITLGILAPLYRFSARLATFYQARADILRLHQVPGYKQTGIVRLSPIFTPIFDFGKSQAMPDHISELIRAALAHGKDTE